MGFQDLTISAYFAIFSERPDTNHSRRLECAVRGKSMLNKPAETGSRDTKKVLDVLLVLLGIAVLILKKHYSGPLEEIIHSYAGNVSVSFAVFFITKQLPIYPKCKRLMTVCLTLAVVELFELLDGFGVMTNVYDPIDLAANAAGILLALAVDTALSIRPQPETMT